MSALRKFFENTAWERGEEMFIRTEGQRHDFIQDNM